MKTALVTGASHGGIGSALVEAFHRQGYHVFATVRSTEKGQHLASLPNVDLITLDVTSHETIAQAVTTIKRKTNGTLDVLVNNAGAGYTKPLLDTSIEDARQLYELNVLSILAMTQAFAPLVIASKGCVVNIASIAALIVRPWMGLYHSSKAAAMSVSETLRLELEPFGVRVITAMIGQVKSNFFQTGSIQLPASSIYHQALMGINKMASGKLQTQEEDANQVADFLVSRAMAGASGCVWKGGMAGTSKWASALVPTRLMDLILRKDSDLDKLSR